MRIAMIALVILGCGAFLAAFGAQKHERDTFQTGRGELAVTFLGHGSLMMDIAGKVIQVDPYGEVADYSKLPKADLILVTHDHYDHYDPAAFRAVLKPDTVVIASKSCSGRVPNALIMENGDSSEALGLKIRAVPAYNVVHKRPDGLPFHPKGDGNGYIVDFGGFLVYIGGDTEDIPEMAALKDIDVAFLPMNLPYTMTPEMVARAARMFRPKILYPYHFGKTDTSKLVTLLEADKDIEVRVRKLS